MNKELKQIALNLLASTWKVVGIVCLISLFMYEVLPQVILNTMLGGKILHLLEQIASQPTMQIDPNIALEIASKVLVALPFFLITSLVMGAFTVSFAWVSLDLVRNKVVSTNSLFDYFKNNLMKMIVAYFLKSLFIALWGLLLVVPGIIKTFSYALTYFILKDNPELTVNQAITRSRKLMDGRKAELFNLVVSFIGWFVLLTLVLVGLESMLATYITLENIVVMKTITATASIVLQVPFWIYFRVTMAVFYENVINEENNRNVQSGGNGLTSQINKQNGSIVI